MQQGTVKWFNEAKGYGFIASEGKDYFAHYKDIQMDGHKTLRNGATVSFLPEKGLKGACARSIRELS